MSHDRYDLYYSLTPMTYEYPNMEGINQTDATRGFTCTYIAILYIRLFTLIPIYGHSYHYDLPSLPCDISVLTAWESSAEYLKRETESLLDKIDILHGIGYEGIVEENRKFIISQLDELIAKIRAEIKRLKKNYQPDQLLEAEFLNRITDSLSESIKNTMVIANTDSLSEWIEKTKVIANKDEISSEYSSWHITGTRRIIGKEDFQNAPCREDFITIPLISEKQSELYNSFCAQNGKKYLVPMEDLFPAVSKLNAEAEQFVLIGFNINIRFHIDNLNIKGLSKNEFQGIELHLFKASSRHSRYSLFLVRKSDLPWFIPHGSKKSDIEKYSLKKSNTEYKIYTSLLDLNKAEYEDIATELKPTLLGVEAENCMLACVDYHIEIRWKNDPQIIHLQGYNRDMKLGIPVKIKDIPSLK